MGDQVAAKLLDFSGPFDTPLLEQTVAAFYTGAPEQVRLQREQRELRARLRESRGSGWEA
jgi:hypothetical protein